MVAYPEPVMPRSARRLAERFEARRTELERDAARTVLAGRARVEVK